MALDHIGSPGIVGKVFYFRGFDGNEPIFTDRESARAAQERNTIFQGRAPAEGCILSYNMDSARILNAEDYRGEIPVGFVLTDVVAFYVRDGTRAPKISRPEFFRSALDIARCTTPPGNNIKYDYDFGLRIIPVLKLKDIKL